MANYYRPTRLDEALAALQKASLTVVAGGTDHFPARVGKPLDEDVLDVTGLTELKEIAVGADTCRIGALVTWSDILRAELPALFDGLRQCAREIGAVQTQNTGTVVGNLCNASPASDGMPCLLAFDAEIHLASGEGTRTLPVAEFVTGVRRTGRRADEIVTGISVPIPANPAASGFVKFGARKYMIISIAAVAAVIERGADGTVAAARIAVGSCSPVAQRLPALEAALAGQAMSAALGDVVRLEHLGALAPISDIRGSAEYRMDAALTLTRRLISDLGERS